MANIPVNINAVALSGSGGVTGSFGGFTVVEATTFTGLKDYFGNTLASGSAAVGNLRFPAGVTVPLYITSASISAGSVLFYP
jgi:hypothetical protein